MQTAVTLLQASIADNTATTYRTAMQSLVNFCKDQDVGQIYSSLPLSVSCIISYIAWLHQNGKKPSIITTYVAGISYLHQLQGCPNPASNFLVQKIIKGAQNISGKPDMRMPITPSILQRMVAALPNVGTNLHDRTLLAEITCKGKDDVHKSHLANVIMYSKIELMKKSEILLTMKHFKYSSRRPLQLFIPYQTTHLSCPVLALT